MPERLVPFPGRRLSVLATSCKCHRSIWFALPETLPTSSGKGALQDHARALVRGDPAIELSQLVQTLARRSRLLCSEHPTVTQNVTLNFHLALVVGNPTAGF